MRPYATAPTLPARRFRALGLLLALAGLGSGVEAQVPVKPDTAGRDSLPRFELPTLTVTRTVEPLDRVPAAVGFLGRTDIRRAQLTIGADEALTNLPGVYVANRYNFSVDQRISIRGAGSRANFGARGVKILLDDVPQTLPDGQSQLTNVEFGTLDRVEVLRGAASSLYGNASGGVISFRSEAAGQSPLAAAARLEGGAAGSTKWQVRGAGRSGRLGAALSASLFLTDGFRQQSAAEIRQLNVGADYALSEATELRVRLGLADTPTAENPGALTEAEYAANPDSAPANNINRQADKAVQQQQLAVTVRHTDTRGNTLSGTAFGLLRDLDNPLATNNIVVIDRQAGGIRLQASRHLGAESAPRLTAGIDGQVMQDDRQNYLGDGAGERTDSLTIDQVERVSEVGPFAQLTWSPQPKVTISAGVRYDNVQFEVDDLHLTDGVDNSGDRTMSAWSGNLGVSYAVQESFIPYANVSTAFETPTTTELVNQPDGSGGVNDELGPQRAGNFELGARGELGRDLSWSLAVFQADVEDAIVQYREIGGRAFFQNAGQTRHRGVEAGLSVVPVSGLRVFGSYTYAHYRFTDYKLVDGVEVDTLDGNRLAGVPEAFFRLGIRATPGAGIAIDLDQTMSSSLYGDDQNTIRVAGWGTGVTNLRLSLDRPIGSWSVAPFVVVNNLFDRTYVGSVTINGFGGRVLEPSPGRNAYVGAEIGWK